MPKQLVALFTALRNCEDREAEGTQKVSYLGLQVLTKLATISPRHLYLTEGFDTALQWILQSDINEGIVDYGQAVSLLVLNLCHDMQSLSSLRKSPVVVRFLMNLYNQLDSGDFGDMSMSFANIPNVHLVRIYTALATILRPGENDKRFHLLAESPYSDQIESILELLRSLCEHGEGAFLRLTQGNFAWKFMTLLVVLLNLCKESATLEIVQSFPELPNILECVLRERLEVSLNVVEASFKLLSKLNMPFDDEVQMSLQDMIRQRGAIWTVDRVPSAHLPMFTPLPTDQTPDQSIRGAIVAKDSISLSPKRKETPSELKKQL